MGNVPYIPGKIITVTPWHLYLLRKVFWGPKMPF